MAWRLFHNAKSLGSTGRNGESSHPLFCPLCSSLQDRCVWLGVDTSIDEFFDEQLQRVLGPSPATAEAGSWYPAPRKPVVGVTDQAPDSPRGDQDTGHAAKSAEG